LRIRVIKVILSSGEIETLLTDLTEDLLPAAEAGELRRHMIHSSRNYSGRISQVRLRLV